MSGSASIGLEQAVLQHTLGIAAMAFPTQVFVALCAAGLPPSESVGGVEAFGGSYSRVAATFALLASPTNIAANTQSVEFPLATADWGSLGYFEIWSAQTGGSRLYWGGLVDPVSGNATTLDVSAGDIVRFSAGTLAIEVAAPNTVVAPGVSSFNTRTGDVILSNSDVVAVLPPSANPPLMDGVAAVGTSAMWARGDHVHPGAVANILGFDGGANNDDALRFRNAIASGAKTILVPPGTYTFKSRVVQPGPMFFDPPPCVLFNTVDDVAVFADGATFLIDNALAAALPPAPYDGSGTAHVGFMGDCHNVRWRGGRFVGNTNSMGSRVNAGMWFYCVTGITIEETEWLGEWRNGPFNGVWMFDCTFRNNRCYGSGLCWDFAYIENLLIIGNRCEGGAGYASNVGSCCFKLFADPATYYFNTAGQTYKQVTWLSTGAVRQLRTDKISNNVRLMGNTFNKWNTAISLDGVDGASICENTIRDGPYVAPTGASGITITTSAQTVTFGAITRDIFIHDNDIYANGGPGVQISPDATAGVGTIEIIGNRIYDNQCTYAVTFVFNNVFVGTFRLIDNDFNTRTASSAQANPYNAATLTAINAIVRRNLGVTPYDQAGLFTNVTIANGSALRLPDTTNGMPRLITQADNNMVLIGSNATGADRPLLAIAQHSSTSPIVAMVNMRLDGNVGFNTAPPINKPTVTGAKGSNAALASLMAALAAYGLVTDTTTA